jgi:hypothetical protein
MANFTVIAQILSQGYTNHSACTCPSIQDTSGTQSAAPEHGLVKLQEKDNQNQHEFQTDAEVENP